ncbi:MAG: YfcE family phosphodiesterase [Candidatus Mcinerneyibacterium aminivorans]|uniref:Phosphoesterase n=1 Tax=Candidatus Mcinerneyibacterium aminivorans TaxID=2703815 RepID=A0A5D0MJB2_9BACT|nr:MAG: YfcE family phosphodiesterase [Candidatus Mcinerneyibacterium aminivorans]
MRIGLITDTHENTDTIKWAVRKANNSNLDLFIHLGDIISPIMYRYFKNINSKYLFLYGNNDGERQWLKEKFINIYEPPYILNKNNMKFYLTHIDTDWDEVIEKENPDFIFYGHTHKFNLEKRKDTVIFNPGEACGLLENLHNFAIVDLRKNSIKVLKKFDDSREYKF